MTRIVGDCREVLATLPSGSVQMCVTSPPYWGLRDYGTATWEGGRKRGCDHVAGMARGDTERETPGGRGGSFRGGAVQFPHTCGKCGARRIDAQLGLEATPEEYVANMVGVFREVKRVLADDGTLWVNMGDSYAGGNKGGTFNPEIAKPLNRGAAQCTSWQTRQQRTQTDTCVSGLKPKDLMGMPWRLAFALQADGWYLRSDIIWHKPNPMPESCKDRPTKSHEYLFLLSKRPSYYYDADAVREPLQQSTLARNKYTRNPVAPHAWKSENYPGLTKDATVNLVCNPAGRNRRSVWTIATAPFKAPKGCKVDHFATYPPKLVEPCILAGSRPGDVVLDPFAGSGTTGLVAESLGRKFLGIELNESYSALAREAA